MKILRVKTFQETLNSDRCGPASLKMVLDYWGVSDGFGSGNSSNDVSTINDDCRIRGRWYTCSCMQYWRSAVVGSVCVRIHGSYLYSVSKSNQRVKWTFVE